MKRLTAAPTAGLHFTPELLETLVHAASRQPRSRCIVGRGTFRPIQSNDAAAHQMLPEWYQLNVLNAGIIEAAKRAGVESSPGHPSTRTLETLAARPEGFGSIRWTNLYITPGWDFRLIMGLITNFHSPRSTPCFWPVPVGRENCLRRIKKVSTALSFIFFRRCDDHFIERLDPCPRDTVICTMISSSAIKSSSLLPSWRYRCRGVDF